MKEYAIETDKFAFGDNRFENGLERLGLKILRTRSEEGGVLVYTDHLVYEVQSPKKLTDKTIEKILNIVPNAVHLIDQV